MVFIIDKFPLALSQQNKRVKEDTRPHMAIIHSGSIICNAFGDAPASAGHLAGAAVPETFCGCENKASRKSWKDPLLEDPEVQHT